MIEYYRSPNFDSRQAYKLADLHTHTKASDGRASVPELLQVALSRGLDILAITDHDKVGPSIQAAELAYKYSYPIEIITGSEVTTNVGHLLALGVETDIPKQLSLEETIYRIHRQGGLAIAPHPFYRRLQGQQLGYAALLRSITEFDSSNRFDAMEIRNGGIAAMRGSVANEQALMFYLQYGKYLGAGVGASDAHRLDVGSSVTAFQGDLFEAIKMGKTAVLYQDKQEALQRMNIALAIAGEKVLEGIPRFIMRRSLGRVLKASVFGAQVDKEESILALRYLNIPEREVFNDISEQRKASWIASRMAFKMAYFALTGNKSSLARFTQVGNKHFGSQKSGPPYIIGGEDFYYSLSHGGNVGMGAAANIPIGVDVQQIIYGRTTGLRALRDEEITAEAVESDLSLEEIIAKLWTVKEAVAKGTQLGLSRQLTLNLTKKPSGEYIIEPCYQGVVLPSWQARVFKKGSYFLAAAVMGVEPNLELNWIELDSKSSI